MYNNQQHVLPYGTDYGTIRFVTEPSDRISTITLRVTHFIFITHTAPLSLVSACTSVFPRWGVKTELN